MEAHMSTEEKIKALEKLLDELRDRVEQAEYELMKLKLEVEE